MSGQPKCVEWTQELCILSNKFLVQIVCLETVQQPEIEEFDMQSWERQDGVVDPRRERSRERTEQEEPEGKGWQRGAAMEVEDGSMRAEARYGHSGC